MLWLLWIICIVGLICRLKNGVVMVSHATGDGRSLEAKSTAIFYL